MKRYSIIPLGLAILFILSSCAAQSQRLLKLEPLGEVVIPYNYSFKNTPVGGLSGLTYDSKSKKYYVISDDRSEWSNARFYSFALNLNDEGRLGKDGINLEEVTFLKNPAGEHYARGTVDPEGIAIGPDSLIYITSEGGRNNEESPFVNAYDKDGTFERSFTMPETYWAIRKKDRNAWGVRTNLAFESLTLSPDGTTLYAATENALMQDGPVADSASTSPSRIIVYDLSNGDVLHEYQYNVDKVFTAPGKRGPFAVNGLSDLMALDNNGRLLALDRNYVQEQGNHILLYEVEIGDATDIKSMPAMPKSKKSIKAVQKQLIADLSNYGIIIDNFEGVVLGPELPGGGQLLLIVSDNNFSDAQQTLFTAFRLYE